MYFKLLEEQPENGWVLAQIAWNQVRLDQLDAARENYEKALATGMNEIWILSLIHI